MSCQGSNATYASYQPNVVFFEFVVPGVLLNIIGIFGLVGNILSICVLSRPAMRSSINCILLGKLCLFENACKIVCVQLRPYFF